MLEHSFKKPVVLLTHEHREMLLDHYLQLDNTSKNCRFGYNISDRALRQFVERLNFEVDIHYGIIVNKRIVALAQLSPVNSSTKDTVELGISVATDSRKKGYATHLWNYLVQYATENNKKDIHIQYLGENRAMAAFCAQKGMRPLQYGIERVSIWTNENYVDSVDRFLDIA